MPRARFKTLMNTKDEVQVGRRNIRQFTDQELEVLDGILMREAVYVELKMAEIGIDYSYQNRPRSIKVHQILNGFMPSAFGICVVSKRPDGTLWMIDGATRKLAVDAMGEEGRRRVFRCQILDTNGPQQEALLFAFLNGNKARTIVPKANVLNAEGVAELSGLRDVVRKCGFDLTGYQKNKISGATYLSKAYKLDDGKSLTQALFALKSEWNGHRIEGNMALGCAMLLSSHPNIEMGLRRVLQTTDPAALEAAVRRAWAGGGKVGAQMHPQDRPLYIARIIGQMINKKHLKGVKVDLSRVE